MRGHRLRFSNPTATGVPGTAKSTAALRPGEAPTSRTRPQLPPPGRRPPSLTRVGARPAHFRPAEGGRRGARSPAPARSPILAVRPAHFRFVDDGHRGARSPVSPAYFRPADGGRGGVRAAPPPRGAQSAPCAPPAARAEKVGSRRGRMRAAGAGAGQLAPVAAPGIAGGGRGGSSVRARRRRLRRLAVARRRRRRSVAGGRARCLQPSARLPVASVRQRAGLSRPGGEAGAWLPGRLGRALVGGSGPRSPFLRSPALGPVEEGGSRALHRGAGLGWRRGTRAFT